MIHASSAIDCGYINEVDTPATQLQQETLCLLYHMLPLLLIV